MKKFLQIDTFTDDGYEFTHFLALNDDDFFQDLTDLLDHFSVFEGQHLKRVRFVDERLSNW